MRALNEQAPLRVAGGFSCVCLALFLAACSKAEPDGAPGGPEAWPVVAEGLRGPLEVRVRIPEGATEGLGLGRRFELTIEASWPADRQLELVEPRFGGRFGLLRVRGRKPTEELVGAGRRWRFTLDAERSGTIAASFPPIAAREPSQGGAKNGREYRVQLEPLRLEVAEPEAVATADLATLRQTPDLPARLSAIQEERPWWHWAVLVAGLLSLGGLGFWAWRRHRLRPPPPPEPIDPEREAQSALDALLASDLLQEGRPGDFYLELTRIVRRFLERTTTIEAEELTTEEFLRHAERSQGAISTERRVALGTFLEAADLVKFAAADPSAAETDAAVAAARGFCRRPAVAFSGGASAEEPAQ